MSLSIRAYARHRGVSDTAVHKAIKAGRIQLESDGTINQKKADQMWQDNTVGTTPAREAASSFASSNSLPTATSLVQARTANEVLKAQTNKVKLSVLRGDLVERTKAIAHVYRLGRAERDAWLNWPARVSAQLAAKFAIDAHELHLALEEAVRNHLAELGDTKIRIE
jgi:hypothetical protein